MTPKGRPVEELTDEELEAQGTYAHETRNWVFLHGTAEQFANHTVRMLALEQEYLRRHPKRTWQGSGGAATKPVEAVELLQQALAGVIVQLQALAARKFTSPEDDALPVDDPARALLEKLAHQPGGRMHKLELHQAARECGLSREALAAMYNQNQLLTTDRCNRVLTERGRDYLAQQTRASRPNLAEGEVI